MSRAKLTFADQLRKNAKPKLEQQHGPQLRWEDLELLLALVRAGTLLAAGRVLGVNASTVARRLDAMEANLGAHLFDRTPTGVAPTNVCEILLPAAEAMEHAAAEALQLVAGREREPEGVVRVTAPPGIANWLLAPRIVELRRRFPRIQLELDASVGYANLTRREADLALRISRPETGDLLALRVAQAHFVVAAAPELVEQLKPAATCAHFDWITWDSDLAHLPDSVWVSRNVPRERIALRTSSMDAQLHAARAGLGAMLVPAPFLIPAGLVELKLVVPPDGSVPLPSGSIWLVGHRALRQVPRVRAVWEFLAETVSTHMVAKPRDAD